MSSSFPTCRFALSRVTGTAFNTNKQKKSVLEYTSEFTRYHGKIFGWDLLFTSKYCKTNPQTENKDVKKYGETDI